MNNFMLANRGWIRVETGKFVIIWIETLQLDMLDLQEDNAFNLDMMNETLGLIQPQPQVLPDILEEEIEMDINK